MGIETLWNEYSCLLMGKTLATYRLVETFAMRTRTEYFPEAKRLRLLVASMSAPITASTYQVYSIAFPLIDDTKRGMPYCLC